jgi:hypothetical protein
MQWYLYHFCDLTHVYCSCILLQDAIISLEQQLQFPSYPSCTGEHILCTSLNRCTSVLSNLDRPMQSRVSGSTRLRRSSLAGKFCTKAFWLLYNLVLGNPNRSFPISGALQEMAALILQAPLRLVSNDGGGPTSQTLIPTDRDEP